MKRILRSAGVLLVISALFTPAAHAYLTVAGNGTAPTTANGTTFLTAVNQAIFFRPTGEYYFGLQAGGVAGGTGDYAICYGKYRTADTAPTLTKLGTDAAFTTLNVGQLAVVPNSNDATSPTIIAAPGAANVTNDIYAISKTALTAVSPSAAQLNGLGGLGDVTPALTGGIRALTSSRSASTGANVVFAAVKLNGAGAATPFGAGGNAAGGAGLATDGINAALVTQTGGTPAFAYVGASGVNTARAVDCSATGTFALGAAAGVTAMQGVNPPFCYDEQLGRLYVGIQGQIAAQGGGNTGYIFGVGIYPVTITGTTSVAVGAALQPNGTALSAIIGLGANTIVGVSSTANAIATTNILGLRTMHTSTGMAYLIVNGNSSQGAVDAVQVSNQIWAVPLVNVGAAVTADVGCFANVNSGARVLKAGAAGGTTDLVVSTSAAAMVGGTGILPVAFGESATTAGGNAVTDMYVDGDAVYVATGIQDPTLATVSHRSETGLWKSQCVFNDLGQIDHWTDWQKVAPNDLGGNTAGGTASTGADPRIDFAAVDSYTGHVWAINNTSLKAKVTQWTQPTGTANSQELLASAVNSALNSQCYSVLDLNASVTGWGASTGTQLTLFGGQEKVCFAITGSRSVLTTTLNGSYTALNVVMANSAFDYTSASTFITTSLPSGAGAVVALGWSGWTASGTPGFFLAGCAGTAGTAPGLYAFTPAGTAGFVPNTAGAGTTSIFGGLGYQAGATSTGTWTRIQNVSGMPVKIQSFGGGLHVLTRSATIDRIYSTPIQNTVALLNSSFVVTASSGNTPTAGSTNSDLSAVKQIYDFVVSVSAQATFDPAIGTQQLMMLTNDGIYTTSSTGGLQAPSANLSQLNAGWVRLDTPSTAVTTLGYFTDYIGYPLYNRLPQSFWFANYAVNPAIANVFNKNIQYQLSRQTIPASNEKALIPNSVTFTEDPNNTATFDGAESFNQTTAPTTYPNFRVLYRLFYNDGARRFFIQKNPNDDTKYQVLVLPYNLYDYNITSNSKAAMTDAVVAQAGAFYWMSPVGDTGRLMMGTSSGVISLQ